MNLQQIEEAITRRFQTDGHRIVFWNDPDGEFRELVPELALEDITVVDTSTVGALELKLRLEREDPEGHYLLYSALEEPDLECDWLLDIRLYSGSFRADRPSILLQELGLASQALRSHIALRRKFFDNKQRVRKLKGLVQPDDPEKDLDRKMMAVIAGAEHADFYGLLRTLFHSLVNEDGTIDLAAVPEVSRQLELYDLDEPFWELCEDHFGFQAETPSQRTLANLLRRLLTSDLLHQLRGPESTELLHLRLPPAGTRSAVVFLDSWRDSSSKAESYRRLATQVGHELGIRPLLKALQVQDLIRVETFPEVDEVIARGLVQQLNALSQEAGTVETSEIRDGAAQRLSTFWVESSSIPEPQRTARSSAYESIRCAAGFLELRGEAAPGFDFSDAASMYRAYETSLFRFDQLYRQFCWHADRTAPGWADDLRATIEAHYENGFLTPMALTWGKLVESELLKTWRLPNVSNQYHFYEREIGQRLKGHDRRRSFVIISDALRYEVAEELTRRLNGTYRLEAELGSQLGVLPSYTALGMASLLPHETISYTDKGEVRIDGKRAASFEQRDQILDSVDGMAVRASDLLELKKEEGRKLIGDRRVVYIYHDRIDAVGDKAATEGDTFQAAAVALDELEALVRYVVNSLNGNHVLITADHGFLFSASSPTEVDKNKIGKKPAGTAIAKKRYLLGKELPANSVAWSGQTRTTARADGDMMFWVPKGNNLFHFQGGARFVHGGAMLQEIVVPVVTVKHFKDKRAREKTKTKPVGVQVLGTRHRITAPTHRFQLIQVEPVGDRAKPVTLKVAVYEGEQPVTSIETVTFDSSSESIDDRQRMISLTLEDRDFDKNTPYRLVLRDHDTGIEHGSIEVTIDRAIHDDFDL